MWLISPVDVSHIAVACTPLHHFIINNYPKKRSNCGINYKIYGNFAGKLTNNNTIHSTDDEHDIKQGTERTSD